MTDWDALEAAWTPARASGALGPASLDDLIAHAAGYLPAALRVSPTARAVDLGSGVGVPGLLLAVTQPRMEWSLVDANARRCGIARIARDALGLTDRVVVVHARAEDLARDTDWRGEVDLVVARSFGDPAELAECGLPLLGPGGILVVSVIEQTEARWRGADLGPLGVELDDSWSTEAGRYLSVRRTPEGSTPLDDRFPRRPAARRRSPVL